MKNKYLLMPLAALMLAGCDYNEKNFEGLDNYAPTDVKKLDYTLTDADYKTIAENKTNMAIAEAAGDAAALAAIKTKLSLSEKISGKEYLPAFLAGKWYTADVGSAIKITYNKALDAPAYLDEIEAAKNYKLTAADYEVAWDDITADYFSPSKPAVNYLPRILKGSVTNPADGEYRIVEYNYSNTDPSTGGEQEQFNKISDAVEGAPGTYNVKGTVAATYARGFLLTDGKSTILVYLNTMPNVSLGDVVIVKGTTTTYSGLNQFSKDMEITKESAATSFAYPVFADMDGAAMEAYLKAPVIKPVKLTGKLVMVGTNYNLEVAGTTSVGALSYPVGGVVSSLLVNKEVTVTGYAIGFSSTRVNLMVTGMAAKGETLPTSIGIVALASPGDYTVQGQVVATNARSYMVSDGSGSILVYMNQLPDKKIGDAVRLSGAVTKYGLNQYTATVNATVLAEGSGTITQPAPHTIAPAEIPGYIATPYVRYVTYKGVLNITGSGDKKYYNVTIDDVDPATAQGSLLYPNAGSVDEALNGKSIIVTGYAMGVSSNKFVNTMVTSVVENTPARAAALGMTRAANVEKRYAMYQYSGGSWVAATKAIVVNPSDYRQMGITDNNFSSTYKPDNYLAQFMTLSYPYAQEGEAKAAVYNYYDGKVAILSADEYVFTSGVWTKNTNIVTVTEQFVFNGEKWNFDPSIVIRITKGDAESKKFLQIVVDSVKEVNGSQYIDRGTTEYFYGCSAFYGNIEMAPSYWRYVASYGEMTDDQISAMMKEHIETNTTGFFAYALKTEYADMDKLEGIDVTVTINFDVHKASGAGVYTIKYLVTGKGQFEYIPDSYKEMK